MLSTQFLLGANLHDKIPQAEVRKCQTHPPGQVWGQGGRACNTQGPRHRAIQGMSGKHPPADVNPWEQLLPRKTRTTLAQLCSGCSRTLASYLSKVDHAVEDECLDSGETPMTQHISSAVPRSQEAWKWGPYGQTQLV